jgi:hypothetical protein
MAVVDITLGTVLSKNAHGEGLLVMDPIFLDSDLITSSTSSQQSDFAVPAGSNGLIWRIATDGAVRVLFGTNPTAVAGEAGGWLLQADTVEYFAAWPGHKVAVIDA